ncbi:uncharacterized protein B0I36DRAFT_357419 [Microdochium trichocladiopsis]|uniref:Metallo-beta-lactamase domain-containing protein n=1 Tax=Microdochium trichocladiopsis TaxID=1682393 RepID=A0A9P8YIQ2_9PEZI|nr:uncharacterized protein B0I36DRAFT_357419 [Microdochium trichocladiopsis]KAH7040066.1 hypothetical protein B0I36DRAFT_357419 [Microdochium trichocladiopsis]
MAPATTLHRATRGLQSLNPPPVSDNTVRVRMVDTESSLSLHAYSFVDPVMPGHEIMSMPTMAFLIENERLGKKAMFDLGMRKDYWNLPPATRQAIQRAVPGLRSDRDTTDILNDGGIRLDEINDIIWSHSHCDHTGSTHLFPHSTNLCYGRDTVGFPPYPESPTSNLNADAFEGRKCRAIDCNQLKIGPFDAHDFYGDDSLYLLDTHPGTGLEIPLPDSIPETALCRGGGRRPRDDYPSPCPCAIFTNHHPQITRAAEGDPTVDPRTTPFYKLSTHEKSAYEEPGVATATMKGMQDYFDSDDHVLVLLTHDAILPEVLPTINERPAEDLNDWKARGWKERCHWGWLGELPRYNDDGSVRGPGPRATPIVEGLCKDGERIESLV